MTKELFISSTPHETKVALVEDDQVAEVYFERENEYSLAGSIYKGRVTRVLPGMQSAFVDIGLDRDAFLYVSDFLELEDEHGEVQQVAVSPPEPQPAVAEPAVEAQVEAQDAAEATPPVQRSNGHDREELPETREQPQDREGGRLRGRRRRRGRRGRGLPESKFAHPPQQQPEDKEPARREEARPAERSERSERPAPPRYQPIILPGESISKYRDLAAQPMPVSQPGGSAAAEARTPAAEQPARSWEAGAEVLGGDAAAEAEERAEAAGAAGEAQVAAGFAQPGAPPEAAAGFAAAAPESQTESDARHPVSREAEDEDDEDDEENGASSEEDDDDDVDDDEDDDLVQVSGRAAPTYDFGAGTVEEEEIEEDEHDFSGLGEPLDDAGYEELEEETLEQGSGRPDELIAAAAQASAAVEEDAVQSEAMAGYEEEVLDEDEEPGSEDEGDEEEEEDEADLAHAAAEAELSGEPRAELRGPAATAGLQQRAERPASDRRRGRGGRRGGGGGRRPRGRREGYRPQATISELLKEGQEVLVQIAKEPIGKKGARITSHIALPGRFLVYMPTVSHMGVSRKISSEEERQRLKRIIVSERNGQGGFIVRTAAAGAREEELRADIRFLKNLWHEIRSRADSGKSPALIYHDLNLVERILRDQVNQNFSRVWVDTEQEYERVLRFLGRFQPPLVKRVKLYTKDTPLFEEFGIQEEINKALKSKVWLKSGGYIVINQTEALVAIDINTGKYVGKTQRLEDTIVKTNIDAIREIVRQIRLRDLGGIIVIDFIDMDERRNRHKVMQALEEALKTDRAPSKVLQFNDFGLVAITRKRVKHSLERTLGTPCPYCTGTGLVKSVQTVCGEIYVEMRKIAKQLGRGDVLLRVNPEVAKALKANNARLLQDLEELTGRSVVVKSDPTLHQEQFDVN